MSYVIESGIPIPRPAHGNGMGQRGARTPWTQAIESLEVGQSVLTPLFKEYKVADQFVLRQRSKRFTIRKVNGLGWRVWRVE